MFFGTRKERQDDDHSRTNGCCCRSPPDVRRACSPQTLARRFHHVSLSSRTATDSGRGMPPFLDKPHERVSEDAEEQYFDAAEAMPEPVAAALQSAPTGIHFK